MDTFSTKKKKEVAGLGIGGIGRLSLPKDKQNPNKPSGEGDIGT